MKKFDSICFIGKSCFKRDGTQNYLVFQQMCRFFKRVSGAGSGNYIYVWKSKGFSDENITAPNKSDYKLHGSFLKRDKIT